MTENKNRLIIIIVVGALLIGNVFFGSQFLIISKELEITKSINSKVEVNEKVINFTALFIKKVLQAEEEVDFETRLSLENSVRELKDEEVMAEWQKFIGSRTELEAQTSVKNLLGILIDKIRK